MTIEFENEIGTDQGGLLLDWFNSCFKYMMDTTKGYFKFLDENKKTAHINHESRKIHPNTWEEDYYYMGLLLA